MTEFIDLADVEMRNIMRAAAPRKWSEWKFMLEAGVPAETMAYMHFTRQIAIAPIAVKNGRWVVKEGGSRGVLLNVLGPSCEVLDILAWRPDTPASFWGMAPALPPFLGWHALELAEHEHKFLTEEGAPEEWIMENGSISVFQNPLEWLRAGCNGIVPLEWKTYWPAYLSGVAGLKFTDRDFARRASALFERPIPVPPVMVAA